MNPFLKNVNLIIFRIFDHFSKNREISMKKCTEYTILRVLENNIYSEHGRSWHEEVAAEWDRSSPDRRWNWRHIQDVRNRAAGCAPRGEASTHNGFASRFKMCYGCSFPRAPSTPQLRKKRSLRHFSLPPSH